MIVSTFRFSLILCAKFDHEKLKTIQSQADAQKINPNDESSSVRCSKNFQTHRQAINIYESK